MVNKGLRQECALTPTLFTIHLKEGLTVQKRKFCGMGVLVGEEIL